MKEWKKKPDTIGYEAVDVYFDLESGEERRN